MPHGLLRLNDDRAHVGNYDTDDDTQKYETHRVGPNAFKDILAGRRSHLLLDISRGRLLRPFIFGLGPRVVS